MMRIVQRCALVAAAALAAQTQTPAHTLDLHGAIGVIAARASRDGGSRIKKRSGW